MRIVEYTPEQIHAHLDQLRVVVIDNHTGKVRVGKPNIVSVTAKQLKTNGRVVNFAKIGIMQDYGASWFMAEDIEYAVRKFKERKMEVHESRIAYSTEEIKKLKALEIVYDLKDE